MQLRPARVLAGIQINDAEVNLRKDFVNQTRKRIESIKDELSSKDAKAKVASNARSVSIFAAWHTPGLPAWVAFLALCVGEMYTPCK